MMTLQEIIDSLDSLSVEEQDYLVELLVELIRQRHEQKPGSGKGKRVKTEYNSARV